MRITLSGNLGSGKSTVGRKLGERLGIPYMSTGQMFRDLGRIRNLDALKTNLAAENNTELDKLVDDRTKEIDATMPDFIMDSRMAWHFVHGALRVFLSVSRETAARRIMADTTRSGERYGSLAEAIQSLDTRRASETLRYSRLYQVDIEREDNYDLHIITDDADADDVAALIARCAKERPPQRYWMPRTRLVPMVPHADTAAGNVAALPVRLEDNFGFYFGAAGLLVDILRREGAMVPYDKDARATSGVLTAMAIKELSAGDFHAWEKAAGVNLAFSAKLAAAMPA